MDLSSITFKPPLSSTVTVTTPSTRIPEPRLRWQATLEQGEYDRLCSTKGVLQVWNNCTSEKGWSATPFRTTMNQASEHVERVESSSTTAVNKSVLMEASMPLHSLVGRTVEFTYRVVYASESGNVQWLGTQDTNGSFVFVSNTDGLLRPSVEDWIDEGNGVWTCVVREPLVIAELKSVSCSGWAFTKVSTTGFYDISRFSDLASFKYTVTNPIVALALLPKTIPDTRLVFSPVLYTAQDGTLSLDDGDVLLHPGDGESTLTAYTSLSTWQDHIPFGLPLATQTSDFIAVPIKTKSNVGHLHLLPVTDARATLTLSSPEIALLAPSPSIVLFDSNLQMVKYLPELSQTECLHIAVGPVGEMLTAVPAYAVSASISVAFLLRDPGSTAEPLVLEVEPEVQSEHSPLSGQEFSHSALSRILSLTVSVFQYIWNLLLSICSKPSSEDIMRIQSRAQDTTTTSPGLMFTVAGNPSVLVMGRDASKLLILVGGKPLQTTPKAIDEELWLVDFANELPTSDDAEHQLEIILQE